MSVKGKVHTHMSIYIEIGTRLFATSAYKPDYASQGPRANIVVTHGCLVLGSLENGAEHP